MGLFLEKPKFVKALIAFGLPIDDRCQLGFAHGRDIGLRIKSKAHFLTPF